MPRNTRFADSPLLDAMRDAARFVSACRHMEADALWVRGDARYAAISVIVDHAPGWPVDPAFVASVRTAFPS